MPEKNKAGAGSGKTVKLVGVSVDRPGAWDSLEKEVTALAPLYFWRDGYRFVTGEEKANYAVYISLRERDVSSGWHTKKSLAMELRIWACKSGDVSIDSLPLAAGRVVRIGKCSFSSSKTTGDMLSLAIKKTARKLPRIKPGV